jgi:hypothetical protein
MQEVIRIYDTKGPSGATDRVLNGGGQHYKDQMLLISKKMIETEFRLLADRKAQYGEQQSEKYLDHFIKLFNYILSDSFSLYLYQKNIRSAEINRSSDEGVKSPAGTTVC